MPYNKGLSKEAAKILRYKGHTVGADGNGFANIHTVAFELNCTVHDLREVAANSSKRGKQRFVVENNMIRANWRKGLRTTGATSSEQTCVIEDSDSSDQEWQPVREPSPREQVQQASTVLPPTPQEQAVQVTGNFNAEFLPQEFVSVVAGEHVTRIHAFGIPTAWALVRRDGGQGTQGMVPEALLAPRV